MRFRTTVELGGRTATGMRVPDEVVEALGAGRRPAVTVTIGGHSYRSTVAARSGVFLLPLSAENRQAAGVQAGDEVEVDIELDTAPREVVVPSDLASAIAADPLATRRFEGLPYSHRLRWVLSVEGAKTPETRQRRIDKAVSTLRSEAAKM
jgi:antitoxin component of MazEF toxin-antitoxin module